jgi:hypothetical protein
MSNNTTNLYFVGSYKHRFYYTDGKKVYESTDYRWNYEPVETLESLSNSDDFYELSKEQINKCCPNIEELMSLYCPKQ